MEPPNVVLVTVDCFRYDRCGFNGHHRNTTPTLDTLATESGSVVFDHAYSSGPYTSESFPGILAGLHSPDVAYYGSLPLKALPAETETLASAFSEAGYETIATVTNPNLTTAQNFDIGFDTFRSLHAERGVITTADRKRDSPSSEGSGEDSDPTVNAKDNTLLWLLKRRLSNETGAIPRLGYMAHRIQQLRTDSYPSALAKTVLSEFVSEVDSIGTSGGPLFGWTHLMDLHAPIHPSVVEGVGWDKNADLSSPSVLQPLWWDSIRYANADHNGRGAAYGRLYDAALRYIDEQIGRLIDDLRSRDLWDKTILIVTGDHGEALFDRDVFGHPFRYLFDELLHVPLLIRSPNRLWEGTASDRVQSQFSMAWLHELVSSLADVPVTPLTTGATSGIGQFDPGAVPKTPVIADVTMEEGYSIAVRDEAVKYTKRFREPDVSPDDDAVGRLVRAYDAGQSVRYRSDRGERAAGDMDVPRYLISTTEDRHVSPGELPEVGGEISAETEDVLKDLGYVV